MSFRGHPQSLKRSLFLGAVCPSHGASAPTPGLCRRQAPGAESRLPGTLRLGPDSARQDWPKAGHAGQASAS